MPGYDFCEAPHAWLWLFKGIAIDLCHKKYSIHLAGQSLSALNKESKRSVPLSAQGVACC